MAFSRVGNVAIKGISCAVPSRKFEVEHFTDQYSAKDIKKISTMTGVKSFYRADATQTTSDLCIGAAEKLLEEMDWPRSSIDGIIFVTQTPDYLLPATSAVIQHRLGLSESCLALDISLGCSGYVYGLMTVSQFISAGTCKRMLLLVGDTISKVISPTDRSVALLFGDAGSATVIEYDPDASQISFVAGTQGAGERNLVIPASGFRNPRNEATCIRKDALDGNIRSEEDLYMNGSEIFNFTLEKVPALLSDTLANHGWQSEEVDYFVLHQANKYMIDYLSRKIGLDSDKVPVNIDRFGNTSSASIPLVLVDALGSKLSDGSINKICLAGFGVGYSWAGAALEAANIRCPEILYM